MTKRCPPCSQTLVMLVIQTQDAHDYEPEGSLQYIKPEPRNVGTDVVWRTVDVLETAHPQGPLWALVERWASQQTARTLGNHTLLDRTKTGFDTCKVYVDMAWSEGLQSWMVCHVHRLTRRHC